MDINNSSGHRQRPPNPPGRLRLGSVLLQRAFDACMAPRTQAPCGVLLGTIDSFRHALTERVLDTVTRA
eukprot:scaffold74060_cov36-Tisochrysis_lutea.AAC.2